MNNPKTEIEPTQPMYMKKIYKIYNSNFLSKFLDNSFILKIITFGYRKKLIQSVLREVHQSSNVLQIGATYGDQIDIIATKIGYYGNYHLVDINKKQTNRCKEKYKGINQNMNFSNQNGLAKITNSYDCAISFLLLHELPHITRANIANNLLDAVKEGGKVVFIDYHKPNKGGILTSIFKTFNRLYRPFVEEFWEQDISKLAKKRSDFSWQKSTLWGGFYQKVVAIKKVKKD